ncbi:uncharacterized protein LOC117650291 [Thrips palmi]|uniref:Uncharacterized protein LOC117650291 n=1 Tax=Thrips palmi TaxID=161013 RepID=A0A6P8ZXE3_THRPL|nr:uncharacterized protein LOC117650291 [Thrips palmi]
MAATLRSWSCLAFILTVFTVCQGSHGSRGRTAGPAGPAVLRPVVLLETEQGLSPVAGPPVVDDVALMELDQLLNLFQGKGKRSQDQPDKGLTRDLVTQVLQPGGAGMWFGPRLGRRRRSAPGAPATAHRRKRSLQDGDVDNDIPWKLAELLKELQGPKRSPSPCDQTDINCLLASITSNSAAFAPEQQQRPRSEGNLVNFTPRLGRGSGEQGDDGGAGLFRLDAESGDASGATARQLRTDTDPLWFSPRLGRRLLPLGAMDVHAPAGVPPPPQRQPAHPQSRGVRAARSADEAAESVGTQGKPDQQDQASQEHAQA